MNEKIPSGFRFSMLARAMKKQIDDELRAEGLTGVQFFVLNELRRLEMGRNKEVNQRDLENSSHVSHPTMTDIIKRLEKKGYILCQRSQQDKRYKCISTTEKALNLKQRLDEADEKAFANLCRELSDEQVAQLIAITDAMLPSAIKYIGKGCECDSDKKACSEPQGV